MAECLLLKTGGAYGSDDCTASKAQVLSGYTAITSDSDDEPVQGTISSKSAETYYATTSDQTIDANQYLSGVQTIKGLTQTNLSGANIKPGVTIKINNGNADVWSVPSTMTNKAAATYYATQSDQTIASGQYLSGAQTIKGLTQTNLSGANIKPGVTIKINNGNTDVWSVASTMTSKAAATYYATTSDQTIAANQYLSGAQTIKKLTQTNLAAGNIKAGTTVSINNGNANVWSVTGTCAILTRNLYVVSHKGFNDTNSLTNEDSYTMPRAGTVYYGMSIMGYGSSPKGKVELIVNGVTKDFVELSGAYTYQYQYTTWGQQSVASGAVVELKCSITQGTHVFGMIGAHFTC